MSIWLYKSCVFGYNAYVAITLESVSKSKMEAVPAIIEGVREAMREGGLTQQALADKAGVPQSSVARLLAGDRGRQSVELIKILDALGLKLAVIKDE